MNHYRQITVQGRRGGRGSRKGLNGPIALDGRIQENVGQYNAARGVFIPDDDYLEHMRQKKIMIEEIETKNAHMRWAENLTSPLIHIRRKSGLGTYEFEGYAAVYGQTDIEDEVIGYGAFDEDIYKNHITKDYGLKVCLGHSYELDDILGYIKEIKSNSHGIWVRGVLDGDKVHQIKHNIENGTLNGLSIAYHAKKESYMNGYKVLERGNLVEVSITPFPAQGKARITNFNGRMIG